MAHTAGMAAFEVTVDTPLPPNVAWLRVIDWPAHGRSVPFTGPVELNVVPWVAGDLGTTLGVATGAALAFQDAGTDDVCVCSFGDGTANRGDFHENVNLAACWKLTLSGSSPMREMGAATRSAQPSCFSIKKSSRPGIRTLQRS